MNVLLVSSEFPPGPGGIGRHAADLSIALALKGYNVDVYANIDYVGREAITKYRKELPDFIRLHHFKRVGILTYPIRIMRVLWAIKRNTYVRIIFTGKFPLWIGGLAKVIYGKRINTDFFIHGSEVNPESKVNRILIYWSLEKADFIWAVSEFTKSILPEKLKCRNKVRILPNGIHPSAWPTPDDVEPINEWKGYPKLLTVGTISPRKGQHRVINALPRLIEKFPEIHYHIVGINANGGYLRNLINDLNLQSHVTLHGRLNGKSELARAFKTSDIFLMLSENQLDGDVEGFGISILEANLYGLPAIGARGCGIEDAIETGISGELVDGDDSAGITNAVIRILSRIDRYDQGMKSWISMHHWNSLINDFLNAE